jgi:hypothetical protein
MDSSKHLITDFIAIDLENMKYKPLHSFLWFKLGKWKSMREIKSVAISKVKVKFGTAMSYTGSATEVTNKHQIYCLFFRTNNANIKVCSGELDKMRARAKIIGDFLDKPIVDYCRE